MEFAGYQCFEEISRGPITSVYLCRSKKNKGVMLLKALNPQYSADHEISKRFLREANFYKKLVHSNIVRVLDLGKTDQQNYIVMEYIVGWPLDKFLKLFLQVSSDTSIAIMYQILSALQYAHSQEIIHRDLKPSNILISQQGIVKITDFGLARQLDISAITEQGNIIGTPAYMAPEVLSGEESTYKSDIFSLGVTWYELLTGKNPFRGESIPESIYNILNKSVSPIAGQIETIPDWLKNLISDMLQKNPDERSENCTKIISKISDQCPKSQIDTYTRELAQNIAEKKIPTAFHISESSENRRIYFGRISLLVIVGILFSVYIWSYIGEHKINKVGSTEIGKLSNPELSINTEEFTSNLPAGVTRDTSSYKPKERTVISNELKVETGNIKDLITDTEQSETQIEALESGGVYIDAFPWADIFIGGSYYATTPLSGDITLKPGIYDLELRNPSFKTTKTTIDIKSNVVDTLQFWLDEVFGNLKIHVKPWGNIYIDQKFIDTTPLERPLKLKSGRYNVLIKNPYYPDCLESVEIVAGQTQELSINLIK